MDEEHLLAGLLANDELNEILGWLGDSVQTAQEPIKVGDWDVVTVRGELMDMQEYLLMAKRQNLAIRNSFVDLIALVRQLRSAYHQAYVALQESEQEAAAAFHAGETAMLGRFIRDAQDEVMELFVEITRNLDSLAPDERERLCQRLRQCLK